MEVNVCVVCYMEVGGAGGSGFCCGNVEHVWDGVVLDMHRLLMV